jgi:hypothetical protein
LPLQCGEQLQWRSALIRPLVLCADGTPTHRAEAPHTPPDTGRTVGRRFPQQGMLALLPGSLAVVPRGRAPPVPEEVRQELARLKSLSAGWHSRALARSLFATLHYRSAQKTVQQLWQQSPGTTSLPLARWDYHTQPDRAQARWQALPLYEQGGHTVSISRFLHVSRPTVALWIARFEEEHRAGLGDHHPGPTSPRQGWFSTMLEVSHLHKRHPDAGAFRLWSLLARPALSVRTIGRMMARHRRVSDAIPQGHNPTPTQAPQPHPFQAQRPHQSWCLDGRPRDVALDGVKCWSRLILDGSSRTRLAGAVAPAEARWVALTVL